jgi:hypothetical protein
MIPKLMLKVIDIAQVGIHIAHNSNNAFGHFVTLIAVLNLKELIYHLLYMPAVLGQNKVLSLGIVIHL